MGTIFGIPALRNHSSGWPPSAEDIFLEAYAPKFVFFGIVSAVLMLALIYTDQQRAMWVIVLKYVLFFAGALINLTLCYWATRVKHARPLLTPLFFAAPALLMNTLTVPFMWYGGGAIGGFIGSGRQRIAAWLSLCVFALLSVNSTFRIYLAATAPPHVTIGGGVTGNALMAVVFAAVGFLACWRLRRHVRTESRTTIS